MMTIPGRIATLEAHFVAFRGEMYDFKTEMLAFRTEMRAFPAEMRQFQDVVSKQFTRIEERDAETRRLMQEGDAETRRLVTLVHEDLVARLTALADSRSSS